jgi:hypothetical protein
MKSNQNLSRPEDNIKRTMITVGSSSGGSRLVRGQLSRRMNTGTCQKTGILEVIEHFFGGDETCFMASDGNVYVMGEKRLQNMRRNWLTRASPSRCTGLDQLEDLMVPYSFNVQGKQRKPAFTDSFLRNHGAQRDRRSS